MKLKTYSHSFINIYNRVNLSIVPKVKQRPSNCAIKGDAHFSIKFEKTYSFQIFSNESCQSIVSSNCTIGDTCSSMRCMTYCFSINKSSTFPRPSLAFARIGLRKVCGPYKSSTKSPMPCTIALKLYYKRSLFQSIVFYCGVEWVSILIIVNVLINHTMRFVNGARWFTGGSLQHNAYLRHCFALCFDAVALAHHRLPWNPM